MNVYALVILVTLAVVSSLEVIARVLNLRRLGEPPPPEVDEVYEAERLQQAQRYVATRTRFTLVSSALSLAGFLAFWWLGGFGRLDLLVRGLGWPEIPTGLLYIGVLSMLAGVATVPFSLYSTFVIEERFGFNRTTLRTWILDRLKGLCLSAILGAPLLAGVLWFFAVAGGWAWVWCWVAMTGFSIAVQWLFPAWILPLFHRFEPLGEGALRQALQRYAEGVSFPLEGIYVIDGSRRSTKANAFFTGFGRRKRIALFDTLVERHDADEVVAVLAHEIGHFRLRHLPIGLALGVAHAGAMLFLLQIFLSHRGLFEAFSVERPSAYVGLVLFAILATPIDQALSVAGNALSRRFELQADRYAATTTGDPEPLIEALGKLARDSLSSLDPHPLLVWLEWSHPPMAVRIRALRACRYSSSRARTSFSIS